VTPRVRAPASEASTAGSATSTRWRDSKPPDPSTRSHVSQPVTPLPPSPKSSRASTDVLASSGRERHEDARATLVVAVTRIAAVLLVGAALERRDPAHEEQEQGDEDRVTTTAKAAP